MLLRNNLPLPYLCLNLDSRTKIVCLDSCPLWSHDSWCDSLMSHCPALPSCESLGSFEASLEGGLKHLGRDVIVGVLDQHYCLLRVFPFRRGWFPSVLSQPIWFEVHYDVASKEVVFLWHSRNIWDSNVAQLVIVSFVRRSCVFHGSPCLFGISTGF